MILAGAETIIAFTREGISLEFELHVKGCLKRWDFFSGDKIA